MCTQTTSPSEPSDSATARIEFRRSNPATSPSSFWPKNRKEKKNSHGVWAVALVRHPGGHSRLEGGVARLGDRRRVHDGGKRREQDQRDGDNVLGLSEKHVERMILQGRVV